LYRDIKPDNIGFDIRGDVKIFDFGVSTVNFYPYFVPSAVISPIDFSNVTDPLWKLAKELHEKYHVRGTTTYKLTKRCGSPRYMAPEVFKGFPYNQTADVYSFGLLLWQICSLDTPYDKFSYDMLSEQVMHGRERPVIRSEWPSLVKNLITDSWDDDFMERPECEEICKGLKSE
jgi:serine/threonine protein kinase